MIDQEAAQVKELQGKCRVAATDAAQLSLLLRESCKLLNSVFFQQADNVVGTLVAVNASRLLPTTWPVLLQNLRTSSDTRVKLALLRHFACVADRISVDQRTNAFRVFTKEAQIFLSDVQVVVNNSFSTSWTLIIDALGCHAEKELCVLLLDTILKGVHQWSRADALRAVANAAVTLVALTGACGTLEELLLHAKSNFPFAVYGYFLDGAAPYFLKKARLSTESPDPAPLLLIRQLNAEALQDSILDESATAEKVASLPSLIACYIKLKDFEPISWNIFRESDICRRILAMLKESTTRKILVTPMVQFLQVTNVRWWKKRKPVWRLGTTADPLIRYEALSALRNAAQSLTDTGEIVELVNAASHLLQEFIHDDCTFSTAGVLKLFSAIFPKLASQPELQARLLREIIIATTNPNCKLGRNTAVRLCVLQLLTNASPPLQATLVEVVKGGLEDDDSSVRGAALDVLRHWCNHYILDARTISESLFRSVDFCEWSGYSLENTTPCYSTDVTNLSLWRNREICLSYLFQQISHSCAGDSNSAAAGILERRCEVFRIFMTEHTGRTLSVGYLPSFWPILTSVKVLLLDTLLTGRVASAEMFCEICQLYIGASKFGECTTGFSLFDHKDLTNLVYNVLYECCLRVDANAVASPAYEECFYFSRYELPHNIVTIIDHAADISLTNKQPFSQTQFSRFIDSALQLLACVIGEGEKSAVFIGHLKNMYAHVIVCVDILSGSNPNAALHLLNTLYRILWCTSSSLPAYTISEEYLQFINATACVLRRCLQYDIIVVGTDLFQMACATIEADVEVHGTTFYGTLDVSAALIKKAVDLLTWQRGYRNGPIVHEKALHFLCTLAKSPHRAVVLQYCTVGVLEKIRVSLEQAKQSFGALSYGEAANYFSLLKRLTTPGDIAQESKASPLFQGIVSLSMAEITLPDSFFRHFEETCEEINALTKTSGESFDDAVVESIAGRVLLKICEAAMVPTRTSEAVHFIFQVVPHREMPRVAMSVLTAVVAHNVCKRGQTWPSIRLATETSQNYTEFAKNHCWSSPTEKYIFRAPCGEDYSLWTTRRGDQRRCRKGRRNISGANSRSMSLVGNSDDVSHALKQMPFGVCAFSHAPAQLITDSVLTAAVVLGMFQCATPEKARQVVNILVEEEKLHLLSAKSIVALSQCLTLGDEKADTTGHGNNAERFSDAQLGYISSVLESALDENLADIWMPEESTSLLRYSTLVVLTMLSGPRFQDLVHSTGGSEVYFRVVRKCSGARSDVSTVEMLSAFVRQQIITCSHGSTNRGSQQCSATELSTLWVAAQCCGPTIFTPFLRSSENISELDVQLEDDFLEEVRFLCAATQKIRLPRNLRESLGGRYCALLSAYGKSDAVPCDEQRAVLWLTVKLILGTPTPGDYLFGPAVHTSFAESVTLYDDFPLQSVAPESALTIRRQACESLLPIHLRSLLRGFRASHGNHHDAALSLPTAVAPGVGDVTGDIAHMERGAVQADSLLLERVSDIIEETSADLNHRPPFILPDLLYACNTLSIGCANNTIRFSTVAAKISRLADEWMQLFGHRWVLDQGVEEHGSDCVLQHHVGLFPAAPTSVGFYDTFSLSSVSNILSALGSPSRSADEDGEQRGNTIAQGASAGRSGSRNAAATVIERMLKTDLFLYTTGLSAMVVLCNSSRRSEANAMANMIAHRVGDDLNGGRWAMLSVPFALLQVLRASCAVLNAVPGEKATTKIFEGVWGTLLQQQWGRALTCYGHYILQCLLQVTAIADRQWEMLRMLISSGSRPVVGAMGLGIPAVVLPLWSAGFFLLHAPPQLQRQCGELLPHLSFPRRVTLSWSARALPYDMANEQALSVGQLEARVSSLLDFVTRAALMLRSIHGSTGSDPRNTAGQQEKDRSGVQVATLMEAATTPTKQPPSQSSSTCMMWPPSAAESLCLEMLTESAIPVRDAFFAALNRFDFSERARRTTLHAVVRVLQYNRTRASAQGRGQSPDAAAPQGLDPLSMFLEAALRQATSPERQWWLVVALFGAMLHSMSEEVGCALLLCISALQPRDLLQELGIGLARFCHASPVHDTAVHLFSGALATSTAAGTTNREAAEVFTSVLAALTEAPLD